MASGVQNQPGVAEPVLNGGSDGSAIPRVPLGATTNGSVAMAFRVDDVSLR